MPEEKGPEVTEEAAVIQRRAMTQGFQVISRS